MDAFLAVFIVHCYASLITLLCLVPTVNAPIMLRSSPRTFALDPTKAILIYRCFISFFASDFLRRRYFSHRKRT